jgi:tetratricopeptide (TPR) repeat protein
MNSDRRHELQQNELAIYLGRINRSIEPYSRIIAVVVGVVILGALALGLYSSKSSGDKSDATLQLIQASGGRDAEANGKVADDYPNTSAGAWARLNQGKEYLAEGMRMLYSSGAAPDLLDQAIDAFREAIQASDDRLLRSRAHFGIAQAEESLGDIDAAIEAYKDCIGANESEAMVKRAQGRIDSLSSPETQAFLAWFGDQDFTPADPSLPPSLPGGVELPDLPDLTLPPIGGNAGEERDLTEGIAMPETEAGEDAGDATEAKTDQPPATDEQPDTAEPDTAEPETAEPETAEPEAAAAPAETQPADASATAEDAAPADDDDDDDSGTDQP